MPPMTLSLPDLAAFRHTHMPFYSPHGDGGLWLFCARNTDGAPWRLASDLDGTPAFLPIDLPADWNICCPCTSWDDGEWDTSFIAGPVGGPSRLYSLAIDASRPAADQPLAPQSVSNEPADVGFARAGWQVSATRRGPVKVRHGNILRTIAIPNLKYLYRVAYNPAQPHQLWITADLDGAFILLRLDDAAPGNAVAIMDPIAHQDLYKGVPVGNGVAYALREDGAGFEARRIAICPAVAARPFPGVEYTEDSDADSLSCIQCFRKHIAAALGFAREIHDGHGLGDHLDHRADLAAEISQAEIHAESLGIDGYRQALRQLRHSLDFTRWDPTRANLDLLRRLWESSLAVPESCPCSKK